MAKHRLAICAITKGEEQYLREWIEFHLLQGVERFMLFDNSTNTLQMDAIRPYLDKVRVFVIAGTGRQFDAYNKCIEWMSQWPEEDAEWVAFIDVDEFLFSPKGQLPDLLDKLPEDVSALAVNWLMFGSDGKEETHNGLVIERFTKRAKGANQHVKSIVRRSDAISVGKNPHTFRVRNRIVDERGHNLPVEYALHPTGTTEIFRINHYHVKSREEYFRRKSLNHDAGSGRPYTLSRIEECFLAHDVNEVDDFEACKFAAQIRENLCTRA